MTGSPGLRWFASALAGALAIVFLCGGGSSRAASRTVRAGWVDAARLAHADREPQNWLADGRDQDDTYFSPLTSIDAANVRRLGFAWQYDLGTHRGQEATPIVVDGVMYTSSTRGHVYALDAATGRQLWRFDPHVILATLRNPCCDLVNRGVAVWKGHVYVASVDGRLHALDAATGAELWSVDTIVDHSLFYSSTGAPRIAGKVIVIGNSGSDMGRRGVRGYVSAYDPDTGALRWRFFTVPPAPGRPLENPELAAAARTWDPRRGADYQGGGTVWDGLAYDPVLNLVYFGTANAAPYDLSKLGPSREDALYTASILAVNATTGRLAWYYQETPRDQWDFDATQKLTLADLPIAGKARPVLMQASKNGFFYVLDRSTGKLLSAAPYVYVNWASGVDMRTGKPIKTAQSDWSTGPKNVYPSWAGGHTWNPMSYDPVTRRVYIPAIDASNVLVDIERNGGAVKFLDGFFTVDGIMPDDTYDAKSLAPLFGPLPALQSLQKTRRVPLVREILRAWDPATRRVVWEHVTSAGVRGYDGGVLSTAGNLVIQGRGTGELWVYAGDTGKVLTVIATGSHIMAAPMTYAVNGIQYIAVQAGYGGAAMTVGPVPPRSAAATYRNVNRIIAFKLGGGPVPRPPRLDPVVFPEPPRQTASAATIHTGEVLFVQECSRCHVFGVSVTPDLRTIPLAQADFFEQVVLQGLFAPAGMEKFDDLLSESDARAIRAYLIDQAWQAYRDQQRARKQGAAAAAP
jgi:quinohemoprotein ethanol dehydrogenase